MASGNTGTDNVIVFLQTSAGSFSTRPVVAAAGVGGPIYAADINGDGDVDLVVADPVREEIAVLLNAHRP